MDNILEILKARDENAAAKANGHKLPLNLKRKVPDDFIEEDNFKKPNLDETMTISKIPTEQNKENTQSSVTTKTSQAQPTKVTTSRIPVLSKSSSATTIRRPSTTTTAASATPTTRTTSSSTLSSRSSTRVPLSTPSRAVKSATNLNSTMISTNKTTASSSTNSWDIKAKHDSLNEEFEKYKKLSTEAIDFLRDYNVQLQEENNQLAADKNQYKMKNDSFETQLEYMKKELSSTSMQKMQLEIEMSSKSTLIMELSSKLDIIQQLKDKLNSDLNTKVFEKEEMRSKLENKVMELETLEKQLQKIQEQLTTEKKKSNELFDENEQLKKELIECRRSLGMQDSIRRKLHHQIQEMKGNIRVMCRIRPFLNHENDSQKPQFNISNNDSQLKLISASLKESVTGSKTESMSYEFNFDKIFSPGSTQKTVFEEISPLIQSALDGYNICVFAYGQTGSGKTFTMEGSSDENSKGMIPLSVQQIFESMNEMKQKGWEYSVEVSFIEIYNDQIGDLLNNRSKSHNNPIEIISDGQLTNVRTVNVTNYDQVFDLLKIANENRAVAATNANEHSSRSHSIFRLKLSGTNQLLNQTCQGLVNLIDLAGSERLKESGAVGDRLKETQHINKSLSHLAIVIQALAAKEQHIPFRNCKLTYLLQNSLCGNSKSLMFVNVSPREESLQETVCSLRFASKVNNCHIGVAKQQKSSK